MKENNRKTQVLCFAAAVLMLAALVIGCKTNVSTLETFSVTFSAEGKNGSLKAKVDGGEETDKSPIAVAKDKTVTFTAYPANGYKVDKWTVNGTVISHAATTYSHKITAKTDVKVLFKAFAVAVTDVTLKTELTLEEGTSETLTATVSPADATNKKVTWSSDKQEVAVVDQNGKVTAKTIGTAKITVTTEDGNKTAECTVTVTVPKYQISFAVEGGNGTLKAKADGITETDTSPITVEKGKTITFTATADTEDYEVKEWTNNGDPIAAAGTKSTYTHTVTALADIRVSFTRDKTYTVGTVNFTMKRIAAVPNGRVGHSAESNNEPHTVSLSAYLIGETEVTQELWQAVMGSNPSNFNDSIKNPVEMVNWYGCIAFCNELTKKVYGSDTECIYTVDGHVYGTTDAAAGKTPVMDMSKKGFRLPTEAEWEWAAMGGKSDRWAGTNKENELERYAWYAESNINKTYEVKKKEANDYGLYDMSGNVWEWCWDCYGSLSGTLPPDYANTAPSGDRVRRGGSWGSAAKNAARAFRASLNPARSDFNLGLRLVSRP